MRRRRAAASIGVAFVIAAAIATEAGASLMTPAVHSEPPVQGRAVKGEGAALKRIAVSWVYFTSRGNAQRACRLQVARNVVGVPCDQLPGYGQRLHCPADLGGSKTDSIWRMPEESVVKVRVKGEMGSVVVRASSRRSKMSGKASFRRVGPGWRILSFESEGRKFSPAGLIFTDGADIREALWPPHC